MPTLTSVTALAGAIEDTQYGISYVALKSAANESANTDGFVIMAGANGTVWYNTGSTTTPSYVELDFATYDYVLRSDGLYRVNTNALEGNLGGDNVTDAVYTYTKVSGSDGKIYWHPDANESSDANGNGVVDSSESTAAFKVRAIDNIDSVWGNIGDTLSSGSVDVNIKVTPVNDAPVFTLDNSVASPLVVAEDANGTGAVTVAGFANGIGPGGGADEAGQTLNFTLTTSNDAAFDTLPTISSTDGNLSFDLAQDFNGDVTVTVSLHDSGGTANGGVDTTTQTFTLHVTPVNDAPVNTVPGAQTIDSDTTDTLVFNTISVADVDVGAGNLTVDLSVNGGTLALGSTAGLTGDLNGADGHLTITGTQSAVNAALNGLTYVADTDNGDRTLTVSTSDNGNSGAGGVLHDTDTVTIHVQGNQAPVAVDDINSVSDNGLPTDGNSTTGNVLSNDTDADGDPLSVTAYNTDVGSYGTLTWGTDGSYTYTVTDDSLALGETVTDTFTYTVSDGVDSDTGTLSITVTGANDAPIAADDATDTVVATGTLVEGADVGQTTGTAADLNGYAAATGTVTNYSGADGYDWYAINLQAGHAYTIDLRGSSTGGGTLGDPFIDIYNSTGAWVDSDDDGGTNLDSHLVFTPSTSGTYYLAVRAWSSSGGGTYTLEVDGQTQLLTDDGIPAFGNVLANDTDTDNGAILHVAAVNGSDADVGAVLHATYGDLTLNADGSYSYVVTDESIDDGEVVTDTFTYTVSDEHGATDTATLTITAHGQNDAPTVSDGTLTNDATENGADATGNLLVDSGATDVDIEPIWVAHGTDAPGTLTGAHGTLTWGSDGSYTYHVTDETMYQGEAVTENFSFTVTDGDASTDVTLSVTAHGVNDPVTAYDDTDTVFDNGVPGNGDTASGNVLDNDSDVDDIYMTDLTVAAVNGSDADVGVAVSGAYGSLTLNADGSYSYVVTNPSLDDGEVATENFSYVVTDEFGSTDLGMLSITVNGQNDAPTVSDGTLTNDAYENGANAIGNLLTDSGATDVDIEPLAVAYGTDVDGGTIMGLYGNLTWGSDGSYTYTVTDETMYQGQALAQNFTFTVTDGDATTDVTLTVTAHGVNDPVTAYDDTDTVFDNGVPGNGDTASGNVLDNDSDVDDIYMTDLTVAAVNGSDADVGVAVSGAYGSLTLNADGSYSYVVTNPSLDDGEVATENFSYVVTDEFGSTDLGMLSITVNGQNDAPTVSDGTLTNDATENGADAIGNLLTDSGATDADIEPIWVAHGTDVPGVLTGSHGTLTWGSDGGYTYHVTDESLDDGDVASDTFTFTVTDGDATTDVTLTVNAHGTNDAVILDMVTDSLTVNSGSDLAITGVTVSDTDAGEVLHVNLTVTNGTLALGTDLGLTFSDANGADGDLAFRGDEDAVNAALASLTYHPLVVGDDALVVTVEDENTLGDTTMAVGAIDITVSAADNTYAYTFAGGTDTTTLNNFAANGGQYDSAVISGVSAADLMVYDAGIGLGLSDGGDHLVLGGAGLEVLDGSTVSFADGSVLIANTGAKTTLLGSAMGDDQLLAGANGDTLRGLGGNDLLIGGAGKDRLMGDDGNDALYGGSGNDYLNGGAGTDAFVYYDSNTDAGTLAVTTADNGTMDTIADFQNGIDFIHIMESTAMGGPAANIMWYNMTAGDYANFVTEKDVTGGTLLTFDGGSKVLLLGVTSADIDETDFYVSWGAPV